MKILAIDTATELCSAALLVGDAMVTRELETARGHAEHILPMIDAVLVEGGLELRDLDAIAFGRGPGGFTGLRLAASVTQGLAFGAGLPVVPVSNLAAVARRAFDLEPRQSRVLVCNDARMREVYWATFERTAAGGVSLLGAEQVGPASGVTRDDTVALGAGRGFRIYPELASLVSRTLDDLLPRAAEIAKLAVDAPRVAAEQAIPVYVRDNVATPPS